MKTVVIVNLQVEGMHMWPEAKDIFPDVAFLSQPHRHIFHITCKKLVSHDDRDVEFIRFKREIQLYLSTQYVMPNEAPVHDFGRMSCERLAKDLIKEFGLVYCRVMEDGENGAEVVI